MSEEPGIPARCRRARRGGRPWKDAPRLGTYRDSWGWYICLDGHCHADGGSMRVSPAARRYLVSVGAMRGPGVDTERRHVDRGARIGA